MSPEEKTYREHLRKLNIKEQKFVQEYLIHGNATRAAKKAGYAERSAQQIGFEILLKPVINEVVTAGRESMAQRLDATAEKILSELAASAFSNLSHYYINDEGYLALEEGAPAEAMRAVQSFEREQIVKEDGSVVYRSKFRFWDKVAAANLLGKKLKLFVEKIEIENPQDEAYRLLLKQLKAEQEPKSRGE